MHAYTRVNSSTQTLIYHFPGKPRQVGRRLSADGVLCEICVAGNHLLDLLLSSSINLTPGERMFFPYIHSPTSVSKEHGHFIISRPFHQPNHYTTILQPFFPDHPGEPVPEENLWTSWCKGRLTEADTNHPAGSHSIRTNQCPPASSPQPNQYLHFNGSFPG